MSRTPRTLILDALSNYIGYAEDQMGKAPPGSQDAEDFSQIIDDGLAALIWFNKQAGPIWIVYGECHESGSCLVDSAHRSVKRAVARQRQLNTDQEGEATWWVEECELGDNSEQ